MNIKTLLENPYLIKYKAFILPALAILISLALLILVVYPQAVAGFEQQRQVSEIRAKVDFLTKKSEDLAKVDTALYQGNLNTALLAVPQEKDVSGAIGQVLYLVSRNQLSVDSVGFGAAVEEDGIATFMTRLEVQGEMQDVKSLIADAGSSPRILKVSGIELSGSRGVTRVQAAIGLSVYFQPLPTVIGKIDQPLISPTPKDLELLAVIKSKINSSPVVSNDDITGLQGKTDPFR